MGLLDKAKAPKQPVVSANSNNNNSNINKTPPLAPPPPPVMLQSNSNSSSSSSTPKRGSTKKLTNSITTTTNNTTNNNSNKNNLIQDSITSNNLKLNGNKKASYSFNTDNLNNTESIESSCKDQGSDQMVKKQQLLNKKSPNCHDNPVYESDSDQIKIEEQQQLTQQKTKIIINSIQKNGNQDETVILENSDKNSNVATVYVEPSSLYTVASKTTTLLYITSEPQKQSEDIINNSKLEDTSKEAIENYINSSMTSYNVANTDKLAAAAAAAVSTMADIPNFGNGLVSIMDQAKMDEIELNNNGKSFQTKISQSHGFIFGEGNNASNNIKTACANSQIGSGLSDDDAHLKLTSNLSYDIKVRRRRACQMKLLVVLLAILAAACIACIMGYFFIKYNNENLRHLKYTQNMVAERTSKLGSNRLEVVVPFITNATSLNHKITLTNKIKEIIYESFLKMNKTVEFMKLYKLCEIKENEYQALVDVVLKNAQEFSDVPLIEAHSGRISVDQSSNILKIYIDNFKNITRTKNLNLNISFNQIEILFDLKNETDTKDRDESNVLADGSNTVDNSNILSAPTKISQIMTDEKNNNDNGKKVPKTSSVFVSSRKSDIILSSLTITSTLGRTSTSTAKSTIKNESTSTLKIIITMKPIESTTKTSKTTSNTTIVSSAKTITSTLPAKTTSKMQTTTSTTTTTATTSNILKEQSISKVETLSLEQPELKISNEINLKYFNTTQTTTAFTTTTTNILSTKSAEKSTITTKITTTALNTTTSSSTSTISTSMTSTSTTSTLISTTISTTTTKIQDTITSSKIMTTTPGTSSSTITTSTNVAFKMTSNAAPVTTSNELKTTLKYSSLDSLSALTSSLFTTTFEPKTTSVSFDSTQSSAPLIKLNGTNKDTKEDGQEMEDGIEEEEGPIEFEIELNKSNMENSTYEINSQMNNISTPSLTNKTRSNKFLYKLKKNKKLLENEEFIPNVTNSTINENGQNLNNNKLIVTEEIILSVPKETEIIYYPNKTYLNVTKNTDLNNSSVVHQTSIADIYHKFDAKSALSSLPNSKDSVELKTSDSISRILTNNPTILSSSPAAIQVTDQSDLDVLLQLDSRSDSLLSKFLQKRLLPN